MSTSSFSIVAVDLAAKYSAACWMGEFREVYRQVDSWQKTEREFIDLITDTGNVYSAPPMALVVEDLPARVPWMTTVKNVCRLQGRIAERMDSVGQLDKVLFVPPAQWRAHYPDLKRGTGPGIVVEVAARYGYTAPDLTDRIGKGEKATARKVVTDYAAAYLIARWAVETFTYERTLDVARTSRYHTN